MALLNTAMNAVGTVAALKSLFGEKPKGSSSGKMNEFLAQVRSSSVARTNLFDVTINAPKVLIGKKADAAAKISLFGHAAQLPGYYIQTSSVKRYGYGVSDKFAYGIEHNDITIKFIGDGKGEVYKFFYNWIQNIVRGDYSALYGQTDSNAKEAFEVDFREDYATDIDINTYNEQGKEVLINRLISAYPINITEVDLDWGGEGMMEFSVQFTFRTAQLRNAEDPPIADTGNGIQELSLLQKLVKIGTAVQVISSLKRPSNVQQALSSASTVKNLF
jgi:hypothetical protein